MIKKISIFLFILLTAGISACKQYTANVEEFLSYWSSEASVIEADIKGVLSDKDGYPSLASDTDGVIVLKVKNPKKYEFLLPTATERRSAFTFEKGVRSTADSDTPVPDTDYRVSKIDDSTLKLEYKKHFLQAHEHGAYELNPVIVLWSREGRRFHESFTFKIRANTPPPALQYRALGKTQASDGKSYYVLCLEVKDMNKTISTGRLHKDIAALSITAAGGAKTTIPLTVGENGFNIDNSNGLLLAYGNVQKLEAGDIDTGTPDEIPADGWLIYVKTGVEVKGGTQEYGFKLFDQKGLSSADELKANTATNKLPPVKLFESADPSSNEITAEEESSAHPLNSGTGAASVSLQVRAQTGASITGTVERKTGSSWTSVSPVSGTTNAAIVLAALGTHEHEAIYKITAKASGTGYTDSGEATFYVKLTQDIPVYFRVVNGEGGSLKGVYGTNEQTASGSGTASLAVPAGGSIIFTAVPDTGYEVESWSTNVTLSSADSTAAALSGVNGIETVTVTFKKKEYTVSFSVQSTPANGSLIGEYQGNSRTASGNGPAALTVPHSGVVVFTAVPASGYKPVWSNITAQAGNQNKAELTVTQADSVSVRFVPEGNYTIIYHLGGGNDDHHNPASYNVGTAAITLQAPTKAGYTFAGWYQDSSFSGSAITQIAQGSTGNKEFWAKWDIITHTVAFSVDGGNGQIKAGSDGFAANGSIHVPHGGSVIFTAQPNQGYEVDRWEVNGNAVGGKNLTHTLNTITSAGNRVRVRFKKIALPVLKIKQNFSSDEEKNISAEAKSYVTEDIIPDAAQYTETNPLVIYNKNGKARLSLTAPAGAAACYTLDDGQSANTTEIPLNTAKKYKLEVWTQKSGLQSDKAVLYVEVKNGLGSYTELQNTVKNAPVVTGGITITINTNALDCSAEPSEIAVTGSKKLIIQSSQAGSICTINANQKGRIFKISGAGTELTLKDIKLAGGTANQGGAVYLESGSFIMKGASYIVPGANGKNDVYLADGTAITVDGHLALPPDANGTAALISTGETAAPSGYTADGTKQVLSLINGAAQTDCGLFKLVRATHANVSGEAGSGFLSTKYGIQFKSGSPAKGVIAEMGSSGSVSPYEPSPYAFVLTPSAPIQFTQGGTSNAITFTLKKKPSAPGGQAQPLDSGTQFKLKMELYQDGSSLAGLGDGQGVKTGGQNTNGISITLPSYLPAGTYQLYLKAEVSGQSYDGWQAVVLIRN